jgi:seryl-tRNA synthetase
MIDLKKIETNEAEVVNNLKRRNFDISSIDQINTLNKKRKELIQTVESARSEINSLSKEIGMLKKSGADASDKMEQVSKTKIAIEDHQSALAEVEQDLQHLLSIIPNLIDDSVPTGKSEEDNIEIKKWGTPRAFDFKVLDHAELGEKLGMLDFEAAALVTGSRFVFYKKDLARLERALANFMIDFHLDNGYQEIAPPLLVHERSMFGTGQLPKFKEDAFKLEGFDFYLIPTSEVPVTNIKREQIFDAKEFPLKYVAWTPCFRSEAGSHGKDTKGLIRMHQFNKVEMVNIVSKDQSDQAHQQMIEAGCSILEKLGLPYRAVVLCSADIGFSARKTVDLEVWIPSQNCYREISSISNCWDFQARRANIRYREGQNKPEFAHTLNGSGLAVGRTLVAILENYQQSDGSVILPEVIRPYMGGMTKISAV